MALSRLRPHFWVFAQPADQPSAAHIFGFSRSRLISRLRPIFGLSRSRLTSRLRPIFGFSRSRLTSRLRPIFGLSRSRLISRLRPHFWVESGCGPFGGFRVCTARDQRVCGPILWGYFCTARQYTFDASRDPPPTWTCTTPPALNRTPIAPKLAPNSTQAAFPVRHYPRVFTAPVIRISSSWADARPKPVHGMARRRSGGDPSPTGGRWRSPSSARRTCRRTWHGRMAPA